MMKKIILLIMIGFLLTTCATDSKHQYVVLSNGLILNTQTGSEIYHLPITTDKPSHLLISLSNEPPFALNRLDSRRVIAKYNPNNWQVDLKIEMAGPRLGNLSDIYALNNKNLLYVGGLFHTLKGGKFYWLNFFNLSTKTWSQTISPFTCFKANLLYEKANKLYIVCGNYLTAIDSDNQQQLQKIEVENWAEAATYSPQGIYILDKKGQVWLYKLDDLENPQWIRAIDDVFLNYDILDDRKIGIFNKTLYIPLNRANKTAQILILDLENNDTTHQPINLDYHIGHIDFAWHNNQPTAFISQRKLGSDVLATKLIKYNLQSGQKAVLYTDEFYKHFSLFNLSKPLYPPPKP